MIVEVCGGNNWFAPGPNVNISVVIRNGGKTRKRKEKWDLAEKKILFG